MNSKITIKYLDPLTGPKLFQIDYNDPRELVERLGWKYINNNDYVFVVLPANPTRGSIFITALASEVVRYYERMTENPDGNALLVIHRFDFDDYPSAFEFVQKLMQIDPVSRFFGSYSLN